MGKFGRLRWRSWSGRLMPFLLGRRTGLIALLVCAVVVLPAVAPSPVRASTGTGSLSFVGSFVATLFPSGMLASGSISAEATAAVAGLDVNGNPYAATWLLAPLSTSHFEHREDCPPFLAVPPTDGIGVSDFSITGGGFTVGGTSNPAVLSGTMSWNFEGTTLVFNIDRYTVTGLGGTIVATGGGINPGTGQLTTMSPLTLSPNCLVPGPHVGSIAVSAIQLD
jgi:hypothetical protein